LIVVGGPELAHSPDTADVAGVARLTGHHTPPKSIAADREPWFSEARTIPVG
jgi:hypothetical protein